MKSKTRSSSIKKTKPVKIDTEDLASSFNPTTNPATFAELAKASKMQRLNTGVCKENMNASALIVHQLPNDFP